MAMALGENYDIIALQEPWINRQTRTTYCPSSCAYNVVYKCGRAAIYLHKRFDASTITNQAGEDWCYITFGSGASAFTVWSLYSPNQAGSRWISPITSMPATAPPGGHIVVGDFNAHHPLWDIHERHSRGCENVIAFAERWGLELLTPYGEITRQRHGQKDSTIDLAWASPEVRSRHDGDQGLNGSDHRAQGLTILSHGESVAKSAKTPEGWNWAMLDKELVRAEAKLLFRHIVPVDSMEELKQAFDWVVGSLQTLADLATPKRKVSTGKGMPWWCREVQEAATEAKRERRRYLQARCENTWQRYSEAVAKQKREIGAAQERSWYQKLEDTARDSESLWSLQRWARLRSQAPPEEHGIPALKRSEGDTQPAVTHAEKTKVLADRFFPSPPADLTDVVPDPLSLPQRFVIDKEVDELDIQIIVASIASWKSPGDDLLPNGFLTACGEPLYRCLAYLSNKSFELGWFPERFRTARVAVIPKPNKPVAQRSFAGGWRPIALLSSVGKIVETLLAKRIAAAAEKHFLLPAGQMGNRKERSAELAIRMVVDIARTAWDRKALTSLLQLDIKGAFDTVNHARLLDILAKKGFPHWVIQWIKSFLTDRTVRLRFDGEESEPIPIIAGVPQGSPLSPILFILYISTLYEMLSERHPGADSYRLC